MLDMNGYLQAHFLADAAVTALVDDRVHVEVLPPDTEFPCLLVRHMMGVPGVQLGGPGRPPYWRMIGQVECIARDVAEAQDLLNPTITAIYALEQADPTAGLVIPMVRVDPILKTTEDELVPPMHTFLIPFAVLAKQAA